MWKLDHVIPASEVDAEEQRLGAVLAAAGYDPGRLPLTKVAQQVVVDEAIDKLVALNIGIIHSPWGVKASGDLLIRFEFAKEADVTTAVMALA